MSEKILPAEEAKQIEREQYIKKEREKSDKELKKSGARYDDRGNLILTKKQKEDKKDNPEISSEVYGLLNDIGLSEDYIRDWREGRPTEPDIVLAKRVLDKLKKLHDEHVSVVLQRDIIDSLISKVTKNIVKLTSQEKEEIVKRCSEINYDATRNALFEEYSRFLGHHLLSEFKPIGPNGDIALQGMQFSKAEYERIYERYVAHIFTDWHRTQAWAIYQDLAKSFPFLLDNEDKIVKEFRSLIKKKIATDDPNMYPGGLFNQREYLQEILKKTVNCATVLELRDALGKFKWDDDSAF
jgi:hypothetical protein